MVGPLKLPDAAKEQYEATTHLASRIDFFRRFLSSASTPWHPWLIDRLALTPSSRVADLGCGDGALWVHNANAPFASLVLVDQSQAMIEACRARLSADERIAFVVDDVSSGLVLSDRFDRILACHMVYHLPDEGTFFESVRDRLLTPGRFVVTLPSSNHLSEIRTIVEDFIGSSVGRPIEPESHAALVMQLRNFFDCVNEDSYEAQLIVSDADAIADYVLSFPPFHGGRLSDSKTQDDFRNYMRDRTKRGLVTYSRAHLIAAEI